MKKILAFVIIFLLSFSLSGCKDSQRANLNIPKEQNNDNKTSGISLDIMVTNRYLYNIVNDLVGDKDNVQFMFKDDNDIKQFKYTSDSLNNISKYDLFIYSGADFEPWITGFVNKLDVSKVGVIDASRGTKIISLDKKITYGDETIDKNPYYWTNIDNYKIMILNIKNALEEKDPKSRNFYENRFKNSINNVKIIDNDLKASLTKLDGYTFITTDFKYDYFFSYYDLKNIKYDELNDSSFDSTIEKKVSDDKKIFFVYSDDLELQNNKKIIEKYNMKPLKFDVYYKNGSFINMMKSNLSSINKFISK